MTTDHEAKAREIVTRLLLAAPEITCARGRRSFECDEEKAVSAIASALREAEEREREACAKLFKQRLEGLSTHARNHIHEDQTRFDIRHKARLAVAEELLSWLATAIRGRNSTNERHD